MFTNYVEGAVILLGKKSMLKRITYKERNNVRHRIVMRQLYLKLNL